VEVALIGAFIALILAFSPPPPPPEPVAAAPEPAKSAPEPAKPAPEPAPPPAAPPRQPPTREVVVVLPSADGHVGTVVVERDGERVVLNQAYATSRIEGSSAPQVTRLPEPQVRETFSSTLTALPPRPMSFRLFFVRGSDVLAEESKGELERMLEEVRRRPNADIQVVGHTDTLGKTEANDKLSLQRAERVKADLVAQGIAAARVRAAGRGEREPVVPTADGVDEPRNRRVEISVR
jgi:outer membrane protein OmpA-like peptidoglycan-associated protein